jgi:formylglycine-generating enzyme required for sulfatase activity
VEIRQRSEWDDGSGGEPEQVVIIVRDAAGRDTIEGFVRERGWRHAGTLIKRYAGANSTTVSPSWIAFSPEGNGGLLGTRLPYSEEVIGFHLSPEGIDEDLVQVTKESSIEALRQALLAFLAEGKSDGLDDLDKQIADSQLTDLVTRCDPAEIRTDGVPSWASVSEAQRAEARRLGVRVAFQNAWGMRFVLIPSGTFPMGSPDGEPHRRSDEPLHQVVISRPYYLQMTEATNAQYRTVRQRHGNGTYNNANLDLDDQPVAFTRHADVIAFLRQLSEEDDRHDYRLPTEAEWEYACRAGTTTAYGFGDSLTIEQACFHGSGNYLRGFATRAAASLPPNAWGLHEMHGNVSERCSDYYTDYPAGLSRDPQGPATGALRVIRGGSWYYPPEMLRSAQRNHTGPDTAYGMFGFRAVADLPTVKEKP